MSWLPAIIAILLLSFLVSLVIGWMRATSGDQRSQPHLGLLHRWAKATWASLLLFLLWSVLLAGLGLLGFYLMSLWAPAWANEAAFACSGLGLLAILLTLYRNH